MAKERNSKEEYQKAKERGWDKNNSRFSVNIPKTLHDEVSAKLELDTIKRNTLIRYLLEMYVNGQIDISDLHDN